MEMAQAPIQRQPAKDFSFARVRHGLLQRKCACGGAGGSGVGGGASTSSGAGTGGATGLGVEPNFVMSTLVGAAPVRPAHPYRPMPRAPSQEGRDYGRRR